MLVPLKVDYFLADIVSRCYKHLMIDVAVNKDKGFGTYEGFFRQYKLLDTMVAKQSWLIIAS